MNFAVANTGQFLTTTEYDKLTKDLLTNFT